MKQYYSFFIKLKFSVLIVLLITGMKFYAQSPGGVSGNLKLWLDANHEFILSDNEVIKWQDRSGLDNYASGVNTPTLLANTANFNPVVSIDGSAYLTGGINVFSNDNTVFVVSKLNSSSSQYAGLYAIGTQNGSNNFAHQVDSYFFLLRNNTTQKLYAEGNFVGITDIPNAFDNNFQIFGSKIDGATNDLFNKDLTPTATGTISPNLSLSTQIYYVGARNAGLNTNLTNGEIAEVIQFNRALNTTEMRQVYSYLAIKYGISIEQITANDYLASNGTTTIWSALANDSYKHDIFGIGKDSGSGLDQRVATSKNDNTIVTLALDNDFISANTATSRTTSHTNAMQYLLLSNNGESATDFTTNNVVATPQYNTRIKRAWRVSNTNFSQDVQLKFEGFNDNWMLLKDDDGDFTTGVTFMGALDANGVINNATLNDGDYVTLVAFQNFPGGVVGSIELWLKAQEGVTGTTAISQWNDNTFNNFHATQTTAANQPTVSGVMQNFNQTIQFDGTNDYFSSSYIQALQQSDMTLTTVSSVSSDDANYHLGDAGASSTNKSLHFGNRDNSLYTLAFYGNDINLTATQEDGYGTHNTSILLGTMSNTAGKYLSVTKLGEHWEATDAAQTNYLLAQPTIEGRIGRTVGSIYYKGNIGETIAYSESLTPNQQHRIQSYLAIKYGISLGQNPAQDYIASDGTTTMWKFTDNTGFSDDVFGIGRDDFSTLNQRVSKSVNKETVLTAALDPNFVIDNNNAARTTSHTNDRQFLMFANNGKKATEFETVGLELNNAYNTKIERDWKVDATNFSQNVHLKFEGFNQNWILLKDTDDDFTSGATVVGFLNSNGEINNVSFNDGDVFTLVTNKTYPGGVVANMQLWLKADVNITKNASNEVTSWKDAVNPNIDFTNSGIKPEIDANGFGYKSVVNFDVGNAFLNGNRSEFGDSSKLSFFTVSEVTNETNVGGFQFSIMGKNLAFSGRDSSGDWGYRGETLTVNSTESLYNTPALLQVSTFNNGASGEGFTNGENRFTGQIPQRTQLTANTRLGKNAADNFSDYFQGRVGEYIIYDRELSAAEKHRVQSYLAFKYGVTLGQTTPTDYTASDDTTLMWKAADNGVYNQGIFGIGKDQNSGLDSRIAKSVNADQRLSVALDNDFTVGNTDASRTTTHTNDLQFLTFSNNGGSGTLTQTTELDVNAGYQSRIEREWRISATNFTQNVHLKFESYDANWVLLKNTTGDFSSATELGTLDNNGVIANLTLADGEYLTLAKKAISPGGVETNLKLWLKANEGVYTDRNGVLAGSNLAQNNNLIRSWKDVSSNGNDFYQNADSGTNRPIYETKGAGLNFNPGINFDQPDADLISQLSVTNALYTFIIIYTKNNLSPGASRALSSSGNFNWLIGAYNGYDRYHPYGWVNNATTKSPINEAQVVIATNSGTASAFYVNNKNLTTNSTYVGTPGPLLLGGARGSYNEPHDGNIAEVIYYDKVLSVAERNQIESYLAIKYGVTLDQTTATNYIASDGTTFMWKASDNTGYTNDIFGIGQDKNAGLDQRVSKPVNTNAVAMLSLSDNFSASNIDLTSHTIAHTNDKQFLFLSHNGDAATDFTQSGITATANYDTRIERQWKVEATNFTQNVHLKFKGFNEDWMVLKDTDGDFTTGATLLGTLNEDGELNDIALTDGEYLTLVTKQVFPGGVSGDIVMWLRADKGLVIDTAANNRVTQWLDQTLNANDATATGTRRPPLSNQLFNFNPGINFDGTEDYYTSSFIESVHNSDLSFISVDTRYSIGSSGDFILGENGTAATNKFLHYGYRDSNTLTNAFWGNDINLDFTASVGDGPHNASIMLSTMDNVNGKYVWHNREGTSWEKIESSQTAYLSSTTNTGYVGRANSAYYKGDMNEVIVYSKAITTAEQRRIQSYLATKYGITLRQSPATDYVASDGTTKMWTSADNVNYKDDIFGIGYDKNGGLDQRVSTSVNKNTVLVAALDSDFESSNIDASRTTAHTNDKQFLFFANNGQSAVTEQITELDASLGFTKRINREWKVDKTTNFTQAIQLQFKSFNREWFLLKDSDGDFSTGAVVIGNLNGEGQIENVMLNDGDYLTLATKQTAPGGVTTNLKLWLKANEGVTISTGTGIESWRDNTDTQHLFTSPSTDPTLLQNRFNFYPVVSFSSANDLLKNANSTFGSSAELTFFGVAESTANDNNYRNGFMNANVSFTASYNKTWHFWDAVNNIDSGISLYNNPAIVRVQSENNGTTSAGYTNSGNYFSSTAAPSNNQCTQTIIGSNCAGNSTSQDFIGNAGEYIVYDTELNISEKQRVESYLAFKYGMVLDQTVATDYLASDGTTIMWDATASTGYNKDIFGVGRDDNSALYQMVSKPISQTSTLIMSLDADFSSANDAGSRSNLLSNDKQFLSLANNGEMAMVLKSVQLPASPLYNIRTLKQWKVYKTANFQENVSFKAEGFEKNELDTWYLFKDTDGNFTAGATNLGEINEDGIIKNISLANGDYLTIIGFRKTPGGVAKKPILWLQAEHTVASQDGDISEWKDISTLDQHATAVNTPTRKENGLNFNASVVFDDSEVHYFSGAINVQSNPNTMFAVTKGIAASTDSYAGIYSVTSSDQDFDFNNTASYLFLNRDNLKNNVYSHGGAGGSAGIDAVAPYGFDGDFHILSSRLDLDTNTIFTDSYIAADSDTYHTSLNLSSEEYYIGFRKGTPSKKFVGEITEIIHYDRKLESFEMLQVYSYLALKYGYTLDQRVSISGIGNSGVSGSSSLGVDYIASDGTTKIWSAKANGKYNKSIIGIGRDDATFLNQKASTSIYPNSIITLDLENDFVNVNTSINRTKTHTNDLQFFTVADNGSGVSDRTTETDLSQFKLRIGREWKVDKTANFTESVNIKFDGFDDSWTVFVDDDGDFTSDATPLAALNANGVLENAQFTDGQVFTLAKAIGTETSVTEIAMAEANEVGTFTVVLLGEPDGNIVVDLLSSDTAEVLVSPASLTFTAANWNVPQNVNINGVNDNTLGDDTANIIVSVNVANSTNDYHSVIDKTVVVTLTDNDEAELDVTPLDITIDEDGGEGMFTVALLAQPTTDVVVSTTSNDTDEATASPATLTFTTANWNIPQTVTVTGVNDFVTTDDTATITLAVDDANSDNDFDDATDKVVNITLTNDDIPNMILSQNTISMNENGATETVTIVLNTQPTSNVVVDLTASDTNEVTVSPASFTFTTANWNTPQTLTITSVDDTIIAEHTATITAAINDASSADEFDTVADQIINITLIDNDDVGFNLSSYALDVDENAGQNAFAIVLNTEPLGDVVFDVTSSNTAQATVSPTTITFTSSNWNVPQTLAVTGVDDDVIGNHTANIVVAINQAATSNEYDAISDKTLVITLIDDDMAGFTLSENTLNINENGFTDSFTVTLTAAPSATGVVIDLSSNDTAEATVSPASITFTNANWDSPQVITVTAIDDSVIADHTAIITAAINDAMSDTDFGSVSNQTVNVTLVDDDKVGVALSTNALNVDENVGTATFTVVLNKAPSVDVPVDISSSNTGEVTVSTASLTFTPTNWNIPQTVTLTGIDDSEIATHTATILAEIDATGLPVSEFQDAESESIIVTLVDDDVAGITLSTTSLTVDENGGTGTFTIVLDAETLGGVVLDLSSNDTGEATVSPSNLTFTNANWNVPQTVTVTGVDDNILANHTATITAAINAATSSDEYDGVANETVTISLTDDDVAALVLSETSITIDENGGTGTYGIQLSVAPQSDVVLDLSSNATGEATVSPATITFTTANWNVPQTVTVTGVDDNELGDDTATITAAVNAASSSDEYDSAPTGTVAITLTDDDAAGLILSTTTLTVNENGGTGIFGIELSVAPQSDVVLDLSSNATGEATVSPATVTFTTSNWNVPHTITVTGVNDNALGDDMANITASVNAASSSDEYDAIADATVAITVTDDDTAGMTLSTTSLTVDENGGTGTFTIVLNAETLGGVVIDLSSNDTNEATVSPLSLTFTNANWNVPQTVTVTGVNDAVIANHMATITAAINTATSSNEYDTVANETVAISLTDDDSATYTLSETTLDVNENGGTGSFTVVLETQPTSDVVFDVASDATGEATVSPATVTFTSANWNTPQTVTVTGVDDNAIADHTATITVSVDAAQSDDDFDTVVNQTVAINLIDDDVAGLSISSTALSVAENGGTATFTAVLNKQPLGDVIFDVVSDATGEASVSPATVSFTTANWNVPHTITVTGVNDNAVGNDAATITLSVDAANSSDEYDGVTNETVAITVIDDDSVGMSINTSALTIAEDGGTATFTVVLDAETVGGVVIDLSSNDTNEATVSPSNLTFTNVNWNVPQTITVTGINDNVIANHTATITAAINAATSSDEYDGVANETVSITLTDDDSATYALSETTLDVNENGGTGTFTVVLVSQPTSDVVFDVASDATGEATVSPATVTFTNANWNTPQTITVTGVDDHTVADDTATITVSVDAAQSDDDFDAVVNQTVAINLIDDDVAGLSLSSTTLTVAENGGTGTFTAVLNKEPLDDVVFDIASDATGEATVSPATITFTTTNWNIPQTLTVTGVNDNAIGNDTATITVSVNTASSSDEYDAVATATVAITVTDDDVAGITLSTTSLTVDENGGTGTFTIVLDAETLGGVVIDLSSNDTGEATVSPSNLTFTNANWNVPQTVTITGVDDNILANHTATITAAINAATSSDEYDGVANETVTISLTDDDVAALVLSETSITIDENGGTGTYGIQLSVAPQSDVVLDLSSNATGEATVSPATITFTTANWNVPQTVTVTGVNDNELGDDTTTITAAVNAASSSDEYDSTPAGTVAITLTDDDAAGLILSTTTLTVNENGGTGIFGIELSVAPQSDVVLDLSSNATGEATVSPATVTFTTANWNVPHTITVTGVNDNALGDDMANITASVNAASSSDEYDAIPDGTVAITVTDDDTAGMTLSTTSLTVDENGGTGTFTVVLNAETLGGVVIDLSSNDTNEATVSPLSLTFTNANWNVPQTVTVTGVNDAVIANHMATITAAINTATSSNEYDTVANETVAISLTDDDSATYTLSETTLDVNENGGAGSFTVVLETQPTSDVVFDVASDATGEATVSPATVTFTTANWNVPQTVTVTGVDDNAIADHTATITVSVDAGQSDDDFDAVVNQTVAISLIDDDVAGLIISTSNLVIDENGGTETFTVQLTSEPIADVVVDLNSNDIGEASVSPSSLTFTASNWNVAQIVTVTGINDDVEGNNSANITLMVNDALSTIEYGIVSDEIVLVTLIDDDFAEILVSNSSLVVDENNGTASFNLQLSVEPVTDVVLNIVSDATNEATVSLNTVTFTPSNWNVSQTITVTGINDDAIGNDIANVIISVDETLSSNEYDTVSNAIVSVVLIDDDVAEIIQSTTSLIVDENAGINTFDLVLNIQPTSDVVIDLSLSLEDEILISPSIITFTASNWNIPQTITVVGIDDDNSGDDTVTITGSVNAASSSDEYDQANAIEVVVILTDDDGGNGVINNDVSNFDEYKIYPNPLKCNSELLNVKFPQIHENFKISIYSAMGKMVYSISKFKYNSAELGFKLPNLEEGMYIVHFKINDIIFTKKLIVVK